MKDNACGEDSKQRFKYYIEDQVSLTGSDLPKTLKNDSKKDSNEPKFKLPKNVGNPDLFYPQFVDKNTGRTREKRLKCELCPSAFDKTDQFKVHTGLHGADFKYKCKICDYSVKFYANFIMHAKRHKYHDYMLAQSRNEKAPEDNASTYQPIVGKPPSDEDEKSDLITSLKETEHNNLTDLTTFERQDVILREKMTNSRKSKDEARRIFYCDLCPYDNLRQVNVDSHSLRHRCNQGRGQHKCVYCDYTAHQVNFIKEHTKIHFRPFKYVKPEGYMKSDKLDIHSINPADVNISPKFIYAAQSDLEDDSYAEDGIFVDFLGGEVVKAPMEMKVKQKAKNLPISTSKKNKNCNKRIKMDKTYSYHDSYADLTNSFNTASKGPGRSSDSPGIREKGDISNAEGDSRNVNELNHVRE